MSIKYRTGQGTSASDFTDLVVKVGDTLPIGTEVDYDGQTAPAGWQEVDDPNVYSTDETRIGTFLGKPLYRRFFTTNVSLPANAWTNLRYKSGEEAIVNCIYSDDANFNGACYPFLTKFSGNYIQTYAPVAVTIKSYYLEYTKTTD